MDEKQPCIFVTDDMLQPNILIKNNSKNSINAPPIGITSGGGVNLKDCSCDYPVRGTQVLYTCNSVKNYNFNKALRFLVLKLEERRIGHTA